MFHSLRANVHTLECAFCGYKTGPLSREAAEAGHGEAVCPECQKWFQQTLTAIRQAEKSQSGAYFALRTYLIATAGPRIASWKPGADVWTELLGQWERCHGSGVWRIRIANWCDENPKLARMIPGLLQEKT